MVRAEWAIFEEDYWAINNVLDDLLKSSQCRNVILIDRTGQLISQCGPDVAFDLTSFASLCAADFEANYQLAKLIGEKTSALFIIRAPKTACIWVRSGRELCWWFSLTEPPLWALSA